MRINASPSPWSSCYATPSRGRALLTLRKASEPDHVAAMPLDQLIERGHRITLSSVEERFRGRHQIGKTQPDQPVPHPRLHQSVQRPANVGPHGWVVVQRGGEPTLARRDMEVGVLQFDREGAGGQPFKPQVVRQLLEKAMERRAPTGRGHRCLPRRSFRS
ncbi:MAG: hypothetical protein UZ03_NOB001003356 [Nitrospira sp. OLB3]|nr:MAG: hypothetical protein UZ03_NOB001003356 [Nitrospira sp. OLB3]